MKSEELPAGTRVRPRYNKVSRDYGTVISRPIMGPGNTVQWDNGNVVHYSHGEVRALRENEEVEFPAERKIPKTCPNCGAGDECFVADYYEAVRQGIDIADDRKEYEYNGAYESYDDGSTEDECIRCNSCGHEVEKYGTFALIPTEHFEAVMALIRSTDVVE